MPLPLDIKQRPDERVLRQLAAALIFEGIVQPQQKGTAASWSLGGRSFRCTLTTGPFGRPRIGAGSIEIEAEDGGWTAPSLDDLVAALPGPAANRQKLLGEMKQTIAFSAWNEANLPHRDRRLMSLAGLEGALDEGHPYHPCFKARTGFSVEDHHAYGPEAGETFQLVWLAVARQHLQQTLPAAEATFWEVELGPEAWEELQARRDASGLTADEAGFLPLHPWQWHNLRGTLLAPWLASGEARFLGALGDVYTATQSVRTLANRSRPQAANIKLPLNMTNTSSLRILDPPSICSAPILSHWIAGLVDSDRAFNTLYPLTILKEYAGIIAGDGGPLAGLAASIWRQNPEAGLVDGQSIVPFNVLMMTEHDSRPFIKRWIGRHGLMPWLNRLIEVSVLPVWHLLVHHGIAVEAHGQNMLLVHRDGWPERLVLRDFHESMEFSPAFLREPEKAPDFASLHPLFRDAAPDQYYWTDNLDSLRELVMDTLFVYNLSEISHLFETCYALPEAVFWQRVGHCLSAYADSTGSADRLARLGWAHPDILTESLLTRKLFAAQPEYHHRVPNALSVDARERRRKP
ncbi:IucA/IucC family protein [Pararhizobium sp.]|uniref:IucA/IucC family protein n=1 Tax=Pararhizobium sp. TaxID=1977563 RepID=UPI00272815FA|nr:IucA/IucC family protein [Pararhizobium sp.]MDO9417889.1 IucA/IucC family protein [Pararhizobium sp.]